MLRAFRASRHRARNFESAVEKEETRPLYGENYAGANGGCGCHQGRDRNGFLAVFAVLNILFFILSSTMFTLSLRPPTPQYERKAESQTLNYMLKKFSMSSPILDEALIRVAPKRMDATLLQRIPPVIYRGEPSYEVDKAWQDLVDTRPVRLTRQQVLALGKDPDQAVEVPADWVLDENDSSNSNETHYFGRVDVFHQIHCLDALRREAYFEHYYGRENPHGYNDTSEFHRLHLSHCVYLLLQNIMCQASTDMYTHIWTDTLEHPFPDFNIDHQCKDFDAIMAWQKKHALDEEAFIRLKRPPGYPYKKMNRKFKEIHGWDFGRDGEVGQDEGEIA